MGRMKTVVLIKASKKSNVSDAANKIEKKLVEKHFDVVHLYSSYSVPFDPVLPEKDIFLAIAIGGDGTVLKAARICSRRKVPILPVKMGDFGFINDVQFEEWETELDRFCGGKTKHNEVTLIELRVGKTCFHAVNDITICTAGYGILRTSVYIGDEFLSRYRSDGFLISTPTGSTAHSLSIGGPIVVPGVQAMMFTPIAPFTLSNRPLIISMDTVIRIVLDKIQRAHSLLVIDGKVMLSLLPESSVEITRSRYTATIIQSSNRSYFEVLRGKLGWSGDLRA